MYNYQEPETKKEYKEPKQDFADRSFKKPDMDSTRGWMKAMGLEGTNSRRVLMGLKPLEKLGGFTYDEMKQLNMLGERVSGFFHDGVNYFYIEYGKRALI